MSMPSTQNGAARGLDEAQNHARHGGLAGAGFANQAKGFARFNGERHVLDDVCDSVRKPARRG